jgi:hypothetical protein
MGGWAGGPWRAGGRGALARTACAQGGIRPATTHLKTVLPRSNRDQVRAGHGAGKPTAKVIQETADLMAFAAQCMDAQWRAGDGK